MEQGSTEWHEARLGRVTASRINDVMAKLKSGDEPASRANYRVQLVTERITGRPTEMFTTASMKWGTETEPFARSAYEAENCVIVQQVGFINHPSIPMCGASPDGLVGDDGLIEIKCPDSRTHLEYLIAGIAPPEYMKQMQFQMACTERSWCDFVSFDPRLPSKIQMFVIKVNRDDKLIAQIETEVSAFLETVAKTQSKIEERMK